MRPGSTSGFGNWIRRRRGVIVGLLSFVALLNSASVFAMPAHAAHSHMGSMSMAGHMHEMPSPCNGHESQDHSPCCQGEAGSCMLHCASLLTTPQLPELQNLSRSQPPKMVEVTPLSYSNPPLHRPPRA